MCVMVGRQLKCAHWYVVEMYVDSAEEVHCIATVIPAIQYISD
jgi:hypothetical protein